MNEDRIPPKVVGARFTGRTQLDRDAERIFASHFSRPDPDDPTNEYKRISAQQIIIEGLLALGEYQGVPHEDSDAKILSAIERIAAMLSGFSQQIAKLARDGVITHAQADKINEAVSDPVSEEWANNMAQSLRPRGKR